MNRPRILVVEDEGVIALDIKRRLQKLDYQTVGSVPSGEEAVEAAARLAPDLILMDIRLKGSMDGLQAAELIRSRFDIPVVFLTAHSDDRMLQQIKMTEPYGYIIKPFQETELRAAIEIGVYKHKMDRTLRDSERWLAATLKSIGDGVIATDPEGRVKYINPVAEALTGWTQTEALDQPVGDVFRIVDEQSRLPVAVPVMAAMETSKTVMMRSGVELVARDGRRMPVDDSGAAIIGADGQVLGAILVFRDVTERRQTECRLQHYARELETRNEDLDSFAHTLAHDLKSALSLVVMPAELLETAWAECSPEERRQHLRLIRQSGHRMKAVIEEILLLTQVRKQDVEREAMTNMVVVVDRALARLAHLIGDAGAEILVPESWPVALGHAPWIEEVWVNYISNAIKYGGEPPRVELGATQQADGKVRFWVRDNGAGIPPEATSTLFAPPARPAQVRTTGHGLGLSIVKRIVEKLEGDVGVESRPGEGSTFSFMLPSWDPSQPVTPDEDMAVPEPSSRAQAQEARL